MRQILILLAWEFQACLGLSRSTWGQGCKLQASLLSTLTHGLGKLLILFSFSVFPIVFNIQSGLGAIVRQIICDVALALCVS